MKEKKSWQEWKTSILGAVTIVVSGLVLFGIIGADEQAAIGQHTVNLLDAVGVAVVAISGLINVFRAK